MIALQSILEVFDIQNCSDLCRNAVGQVSRLFSALIIFSFVQARAEDTALIPIRPPFKRFVTMRVNPKGLVAHNPVWPLSGGNYVLVSLH